MSGPALRLRQIHTASSLLHLRNTSSSITSPQLPASALPLPVATADAARYF